jgi:hypothetical protein
MHAKAQQRLVMKSGYINIANGTKLVIDNPAPNAITRTGGHIITEGENNEVKWNIGTTTGTYTVPLGYQTNYMPVIFTKTAGTGNGSFSFSTYHTGWNNAAMLPTGVQNVSYNGIDNSMFTIDRFWSIYANGYTSKPALSNLTITYLDSEHTANGNSITESELGMQRWNPTINDWGDFIPGVTIDVNANQLTVANVSSANNYRWWTAPALNGNHALPVELVSFKGRCDNGTVKLEWMTASELHNDHFTLERSADAIKWKAIKTIPGAGNSNMRLSYSTEDKPENADIYYRLQQTDYSGVSQYSPIVKISCGSVAVKVKPEVFPNPSTGIFNIEHAPQEGTIDLVDINGNILKSETSVPSFLDLKELSNGVYFLWIRAKDNVSMHRLMIQH